MRVRILWLELDSSTQFLFRVDMIVFLPEANTEIVMRHRVRIVNAKSLF